MRRLDAALGLWGRDGATQDSVPSAVRRQRQPAALQGAARIFMVSGRSSADEHERLLCNRRFHPFSVYTGKKRREKLNCNNPVRRGLVSSPGDWPWSSWRYYSLNDLSLLRMDRLDRARSTDLSLRDTADSDSQESAPARQPHSNTNRLSS